MKRLVSLAALALGASFLAPAFGQQVDATRVVRPYWWDKPVVEGLGRSMIEVMPNRASFTVTFVETDNQSADATKKAVQRAKIAYDAVRKVAGDKARSSTTVQVTAFYEQYKDKEGNIQTNDRQDKVKGYEARTVLTVVLTDTSLAGRARAAALALGPQDSGRINIYLEQTAAMQLKALEKASDDARDRAKAMAVAAGGKLGDLLVLQEGNGPCIGNWSTQQMARAVGGDGETYRYAAAMAPPPPPPPPPAPAARAFASGQVGNRTVTITDQDLANLDLPSDPQPQTIQSSICAIYTLVK
jgi:uncharacterized protein YggE